MGRLAELLEPLTSEQLERPGLTPDGWSVKDLLWHLAAWCEDTARVLARMSDGTWDGSDPSLEPGWTDAVNRRWFERSRSMGVDEVRAAWHRERAAMLQAFGALEEITPPAAEWFAESGPAHYAAHLPDLEAWVSGEIHGGGPAPP